MILSDTGSQSKHQAGYIAAICVGTCLINIFGVRWFGESEFVFSIIKSESSPPAPVPSLDATEAPVLTPALPAQSS